MDLLDKSGKYIDASNLAKYMHIFNKKKMLKFRYNDPDFQILD